MKRSNLIFMVLAASIIFFGCSKDNALAPLSQSDQETTLKKGKVTIEYKGECTPNMLGGLNLPKKPIGAQLLKGGIVTWYDNATDLDGNSDPLLTGTTIWYVNEIPKKDGTSKFWGKTELLVGVENPDDPKDVCDGKWDMTWHGYITPIFDEETGRPGINASCDAVGIGKEGIVKGLVSKSHYEMNLYFLPSGDPDPTTLVYYFTGSYH